MKKIQREQILVTTNSNKVSESITNKKEVKKDYNRLLDLVLVLDEIKK